MHELPVIQSSSIFSVWAYSPSFSRLLLRNVLDTKGNPPLIDVLFFGVQFMNIPLRLALEFVPAHADEVDLYQAYHLDINQVFVVQSAARRYHIVAHSYIVRQHSGNLFETLFDIPMGEL